MGRALALCARHSRVLLILGLAAGIGLPGLAAAMATFLPEMVAGLLVLTAFRIGWRDAFGAVTDLRWSVPAIVVLQVVLPLALAAALWVVGAHQTPLALALVLAASAPTISGGASLAIILRQDPARVMQLLILGTAAFPLTALAVLSLVPMIGAPGLVIGAGLRALAVIVGASIVGFALRRLLLPAPTPAQLRAIDGAAVVCFAVIVIGLMAALGPVLATDWRAALGWSGAAFALSFGLQAACVLGLSRGPLAPVAGPVALAAGNRNIALYLVAVPPDVMGPIMIFVACWQLPMYLTPILLPALYARLSSHGAAYD